LRRGDHRPIDRAGRIGQAREIEFLLDIARGVQIGLLSALGVESGRQGEFPVIENRARHGKRQDG
jgi:hypothetical protein